MATSTTGDRGTHGIEQQTEDDDGEAQPRARARGASPREAGKEGGAEAGGDPPARVVQPILVRGKGGAAAGKPAGRRCRDRGVRADGQDRRASAEAGMNPPTLALLEAEARFHRERLALYRAR